MYAVTATMTRQDGEWYAVSQAPTFFLDENVQGITDEDHAKRIARRILDPFNLSSVTTQITAVKL